MSSKSPETRDLKLQIEKIGPRTQDDRDEGSPQDARLPRGLKRTVLQSNQNLPTFRNGLNRHILHGQTCRTHPEKHTDAEEFAHISHVNGREVRACSRRHHILQSHIERVPKVLPRTLSPPSWSRDTSFPFVKRQNSDPAHADVTKSKSNVFFGGSSSHLLSSVSEVIWLLPRNASCHELCVVAFHRLVS